ncbi:MAG TPA: hypothetical protein VKB26_08710 [Candidatus Acidoferrales bacterium]|nr:hypothetical protein [Candidatus Acidoferrales bacterium]
MKRALLLLSNLALIPLAPFQLPQPAAHTAPPWVGKDSHQGLTVSADPYSDADRSKAKFEKADPYKAGILAIDVSFKNDTNIPIHVDLSTLRVDIDEPNGQRFHLPPLSLAEAARQIAHPQGPSVPRPRRFPSISPPGDDSKARDVKDKLEPLALQADVVPPNGTIHGFVFFDVNNHFDAVPNATLYLPDAKSVTSDTEMIYFEVPLGPKQSH